jgi:hypothetical protein
VANWRWPHLRKTAYANDLAQIPLDEVHDFTWHRFHGDLDMQCVARAMRPHPVRDQIAPGERLQQACQKAWGGVHIKHEADGDRRLGGHEGDSG